MRKTPRRKSALAPPFTHMQPFPKLPVLGWPAYSGERNTTWPGVQSTRYRYTISGRAAISLALHVLGGRSGDNVLVPTYHCTTMIAPVLHAGMVPMFYPTTGRGSPDLEWLRQANLDGVRMMLVAHYFGLPQPMVAIRAFCNERRISLIEDCAHSFFGSSDGRPVGSWGDVAIASLTKFFPVPEGGVLASATLALDSLFLTPRSFRDELRALADAIEMGARHRRFPGLNWIFNCVFDLKTRVRRRHGGADAPLSESANATRSPVPERMLSSVAPALAVRWIADGVHRTRIVMLRRRNYRELARLFSGMTGAHALVAELPENAAPYVFPLYVQNPETSYQRLRAAGVPIFRWDEIWPGTPCIEGDQGLDWATHVFQLGCHQDLSLDDIAAIAATARDIIESPQARRTGA